MDQSLDGAPSPPASHNPDDYALDCYPYTFSPLLLFAPGSYFDKGYSNYNSVAKFFESVLEVDMLDNVVFDRKNMLYEELLNLVASRKMIVTCCIEAHFTAFQMLSPQSLVFYDPLNSGLQLVTGNHAKKFASYLLMKCGYADGTHITDNKDHYVGGDANSTRRMLYSLWQDIHTRETRPNGTTVRLNLNRWVLFNNNQNPRMMSTQETGNTCYFQTFLFGVLCKVSRYTSC